MSQESHGVAESCCSVAIWHRRGAETALSFGANPIGFAFAWSTIHIVNRPIVVTAGLALLLGTLLAWAFRPNLYPPYDEGRAYVMIANGDSTPVYSYYAGRVFHPLVARAVADLTHVPIDARVFVWISAASLLGLFSLLGVHYSLDYSLAGGIWLLLFLTPVVVDPYRNYYWHDLFYAALCASFFLALRANPWIALPIVFLLYMTRESTVILVAALAAIAAVRRQWKLLSTVAIIGLASMKVDSTLVARALPNNQGIPVLLLDALKVPYNFVFNVCGLELWINTNAATLDPPIWTAHVPAWLHLGNIREVGYSGFSWRRPALTLLTMATAFGVLPLAAIRGVAHGWKRVLHQRFDLLTAFVYGALMFALTPLVGTAPARYVLYGWPIFWLFGVSALQTGIPDLRKRIEFVLLSLCVSWIPAVVRLATGPAIQAPQSVSTVTAQGLVISLMLVIPAYVYGWRVVKPATSTSD